MGRSSSDGTPRLCGLCAVFREVGMTAQPALVRRPPARTARPRRRAVVGSEARLMSPVPPRRTPGRKPPFHLPDASVSVRHGSSRARRLPRAGHRGRSRTRSRRAQSGRGDLRVQRSVRATPPVDGRLAALLERGGAGHRVHRCAYFGEVDHRFRGCGSAISVKWIGSSERSNVVGQFPPSAPYVVLLEYQRPSCLSVPGLSGRVAWDRARSRRQGRQPREAGAERSDAP